VEVSQPTPPKKNRLLTLDYLRGFFIVVIIIDHLSRWPSIFAVITGKALIWVTAAEGFVAISGLLVGYVRGYKNRDLPMREVTGKLLRRAGLLYLWSIIASIIYTAIMWYVTLKGGAPSMPIPRGDWLDLIFKTVTLQYTHLWVHFLMLYALFLAAAPIAVWLLRKGLAWVVVLLSTAALVLGYVLQYEPLQWQFLFFIPSVFGYYLSPIMKWWSGLQNKARLTLTITTIGITILTIALSVITTFYPFLMQSMADFLNSFFGKETISPARAIVAFVWFVGFILIFNLFQKYIGKIFGWLLIVLGTHSLTAYILHGLVICLISYFTFSGDNIVINSLLGIASVLIVWALVRLKIVQKIIPS
jgi:hypothetical protein